MKEPIISIENLTFSYSQETGKVFDDFSLEVAQGEWLGIIGANGSGKSTLAKLIVGLIEADAGEIYVDGLSLNEETVWEIRRNIGMVFQNPDNQFVGAIVEDDVAFGLENLGIEREEMVRRVNDGLTQVRMKDYATSEPVKLSGGQKQRVALAGVIVLRPNIVILDEATAMLDPRGRQEMIQVVRELKQEYGLTVISITHDVEEASLADRLIVLDKGKIAGDGAPGDIYARANLEDYGLDSPFHTKVQQELRAKGLPVPGHYLSREELLAWIRQYLSRA